MTTINADMTNSQLWIPLSEADSIAMAEGFYTIDSENFQVSTFHMTHPSRQPSASNRPNGRTCVRGVGGSTAATHSSGATITRYYPEAPGGGGSTPTLAEVLIAGHIGAPDVLIVGADDSGNAGPYGAVLHIGGAFSLSDGIVRVTGGTDSDAAGDSGGGQIELSPGTGGVGGATAIRGGDAGSGGGLPGGDITLTPGAGDGAGRNGLVFLNLPTSDPGVAGALYSDGAPSAGVPKAVMVSGG